MWIADAHRGDGQRFVVRADEKLTAFMELERTIYQFAVRSISGKLGFAAIILRRVHRHRKRFYLSFSRW